MVNKRKGNNKWIKIDTQSNEIVVNVGDMLQRLTNNKLKSTTHKVVNPPKERWSKSRYSIPFFLHPHSNVSLKCLNSCIDKNTPKSYNDITAGEYLNERIKKLEHELKLKKELEKKFNQDINDLNQETQSLVEEIEKWQM